MARFREDADFTPGPVQQMVIEADSWRQSGIDIRGCSFSDLSQKLLWKAKLTDFVRLGSPPGVTLPAEAFSHLVFGDGTAAVLRRIDEGSDKSRTFVHALVGSRKVLSPHALELTRWDGWLNRWLETDPLTPMPLPAASDHYVLDEIAKRAMGNPDRALPILAALLANPLAGISVLGAEQDDTVPLLWLVRTITWPLFTNPWRERRWSFSTHELRDDITIDNLPEIVFLAGEPTGPELTEHVRIDLGARLDLANPTVQLAAQLLAVRTETGDATAWISSRVGRLGGFRERVRELEKLLPGGGGMPAGAGPGGPAGRGVGPATVTFNGTLGMPPTEALHMTGPNAPVPNTPGPNMPGSNGPVPNTSMPNMPVPNAPGPNVPVPTSRMNDSRPNIPRHRQTRTRAATQFVTKSATRSASRVAHRVAEGTTRLRTMADSVSTDRTVGQLVSVLVMARRAEEINGVIAWLLGQPSAEDPRSRAAARTALVKHDFFGRKLSGLLWPRDQLVAFDALVRYAFGVDGADLRDPQVFGIVERLVATHTTPPALVEVLVATARRNGREALCLTLLGNRWLAENGRMPLGWEQPTVSVPTGPSSGMSLSAAMSTRRPALPAGPRLDQALREPRVPLALFGLALLFVMALLIVVLLR